MFSITTIASSTIIPKASKNENNTIKFIVKPKDGINNMATRTDNGTARPTNTADCKPMKNINTNTTNIKPIITVLIRSVRLVFVSLDVSPVIVTTKPSGNLVA